MENQEKIKILSIDAWRDFEGGWTWNDHRLIGTVEKETLEKLDSNRKLLKFLRAEGILSEASKGTVTVVKEGTYDGTFIEIQDKGTGEPLIAISSIH